MTRKVLDPIEIEQRNLDFSPSHGSGVWGILTTS